MKNLITLISLVLLSIQCSFAQAIVFKSFDTTKNNLVDFKLTHASDINITTWSRTQVEILAKVTLSDQGTNKGFSLNIDKEGSDIIVQSDLDYSKIPTFTIDLDEVDSWNKQKGISLIGQKDGAWQAVSYKIIYEIKVPEYLALDLCTSSGNVEIKGVKTAMDIKTDNGFIDVARDASDKANVTLRTNAGEIFTDFDIDRVESTQDGHAHSCQSTKIEAAINGGGGDEISLTSTCGNIYLRKAE